MEILRKLFSPLARVTSLKTSDLGAPMVIEPRRVIIPLEYSGQVLYKPLVSAGTAVRRNQIIGRSELDNCVHASISGVVTEIKSVWTARGFNVPAVVIDRNDEPPMSVEEMFEQFGIRYESASRVQKLKACGVPSPWTLAGRFHHEESSDDHPEITSIIIKGINEEPTVFTFAEMLKRHADRVKAGIARLKNLAPNAQITLTTPHDLRGWAVGKFGDDVRVVGLSDQYRDRIEPLVVKRLTGITVPNTLSYRTAGIAVISVEYLVKLADALDRTGPFVTKHLTITSSKDLRPIAVSFPVGTTIGSLLRSLGLNEVDYGRIIVGGPMKGNAQFSIDTPLTKSSHGLYLLSDEHIPEEVNLTCINCGRCTRACPVKLQVHLIGRCVEHGFLGEARRYQPGACNECGLCAYVCPSHRPLVQLIQMCNRQHGVPA
ncbi:MAG: 4Fe-4S dicluster domain-containing protein [candidate division Zixibacteria bacterium]|jgi:electron transport complex protein RnfC|nr:4Fe-4S dicluster domain-containing protein [candidate division Zixibacteria bacterium]